jgi:hypothetical protein
VNPGLKRWFANRCRQGPIRGYAGETFTNRETHDEAAARAADFLATSQGLALIHAFTRITDAKLRRSIVESVEQIASREAPDPLEAAPGDLGRARVTR